MTNTTAAIIIAIAMAINVVITIWNVGFNSGYLEHACTASAIKAIREANQ